MKHSRDFVSLARALCLGLLAPAGVHNLGRRGWSKNTLKLGDHVKILYAPLKSGEPGGTFLRATLADGTEKVLFGGGPAN